MLRRGALPTLVLLLGLLLRLKVAENQWIYAGSDSYGYVKLADTLRLHGRFSMGPEEPPHYYRRPLYPLFIAAVKGDAAAEKSGGAGWARIKYAQIVFDLFVTAVLVYLLARRLFGRWTALAALTLYVVSPIPIYFASSALTESLAICLTTLVFVPLLLGRESTRWLMVSGACAGLAALLRPDGLLLLAAPLVVAARRAGWRRLLRTEALVVAAFLLVFSPWLVRNLAQFGTLHLSDGMIDGRNKEVEHYAGFWRWVQTWAKDDYAVGYPQASYYDPRFRPALMLFDRGAAFDTGAERAEVARLLELRASDGLTKEVDDGFMALARARLRRHPLRVGLYLPLRRALALWLHPANEPLIATGRRPWPAYSGAMLDIYPWYTRLLFFLMVGGLLWMVRAPAYRRVAIPIGVVLLLRSLALGVSGFCLPRYSVSTHGLVIVIVAGALGLGAGAVARAARRGLRRGVSQTSG